MVYIHEMVAEMGTVICKQYWSASQYIGWLSWSLPGDDLDIVSVVGYRYYSLVLIVLFSNYSILLDTIYLDTSIVNILLIQNLIYLFLQLSLALVSKS